jgi:hypothetical protein
MKLDVNALRYLARDDFRTLTAVEQGERNVRLSFLFFFAFVFFHWQDPAGPVLRPARRPPASYYGAWRMRGRGWTDTDSLSAIGVRRCTLPLALEPPPRSLNSPPHHLPPSSKIKTTQHEIVPVPLIDAIAGLRHGSTVRCLRTLAKAKLVHHDNSK